MAVPDATLKKQNGFTVNIKETGNVMWIKEKATNICGNKNKRLPLHSVMKNGTLAERLGNGLQNRVEQFDSARYLHDKSLSVLYRGGFFNKETVSEY